MSDDGAGRKEIVYHPGEPHGSRLQMRVGDEAVVTLYGSSAYGWGPVEVVSGP